MIRTLISIALNRDLQGDPVYIRCARCGAIGDTPTQTLHVTTPVSAALRAWPLRRVSDGWWSHLTGPFAVAGWSSSDLLWAIDHEPGGRARRERLANVVHPVGWLRWRLAAWLDPDGRPLQSPAQEAAQRKQAARGRAGPPAGRAGAAGSQARGRRGR